MSYGNNYFNVFGVFSILAFFKNIIYFPSISGLHSNTINEIMSQNIEIDNCLIINFIFIQINTFQNILQQQPTASPFQVIDTENSF